MCRIQASESRARHPPHTTTTLPHPSPPAGHVLAHDLQRLAREVPGQVIRGAKVEAVAAEVHKLLPEVEGPYEVGAVRQPGAVAGTHEMTATNLQRMV